MDVASADPGAPAFEERVLVLAPLGRDAALLCRVLESAGVAAFACGDHDELARHLRDGAGAVLLTEEALGPAALAVLTPALEAQPPWSDLPVVLLIGSEAPDVSTARAVAALRAVGNLTVLGRPARTLTLVTAAEAALRARRRQYQIRDLIVSERAARGEAEDASRVKDEFLATVSHELRTPLSAILLWTRLLGAEGSDGQRLQRGLSALSRSAEAQSRLIEDLLDVARVISGKLELRLSEIELAPMALAAMDVVRPGAEAKGLRLDAMIEPGVRVRADPDRFQQVVWNLLSNAVKFTPPGGRVSLRLGREGANARVEIRDTGRGIGAPFLPHVFERFRQADASAQRLQGGLGLGLAISRQLVELQGGTIRAESPGEGLGAVFSVEIPLAADPIAAPHGGGSTDVGTGAAGRSLTGISVLLVEDDADTRDAMVLALEEHGARVRPFSSGAEVLAAWAAMEPDRPGGRRVLLSDLGLPGMDGYELLRRIRARERAEGAPAVPAALITAYAHAHDRDRAFAAGFAECVPKPIEPDRLVAVAERLARRQG